MADPLVDAGAMLANLLAAADAHGVPVEVLTGFPDAAVAALVGIDGIDEVPLALVRLPRSSAFRRPTCSSPWQRGPNPWLVVFCASPS